MNERIKELMAQADKFAAENKTQTISGLGNNYFELLHEKFAELIVRECIAHGKLTQSQTVVNGSEEYNAGREMGIEVFMNQIKKHFGVEE
jgi:hypothetical protein